MDELEGAVSKAEDTRAGTPKVLGFGVISE
jgi:hypothetical protein